MLEDGSQELARLVPEIPDIGKKNVWQFNLDTAVMDLALYRALKKHGLPLAENAQIIYDLFEAYLLSFPQPLREAYRQCYFSPFNLNNLRKGAEISQQRRYSEDSVFTFGEHWRAEHQYVTAGGSVAPKPRAGWDDRRGRIRQGKRIRAR